jgi:hypothetical protein
MVNFESTTYEYRNGYLIRTVDTIAEHKVFADGSFLPQRIISTRESEVVPSDKDYEEAVRFAKEIAFEDWAAQYE